MKRAPRSAGDWAGIAVIILASCFLSARPLVAAEVSGALDAPTDVETYVVKQGDTLSALLYARGVRPERGARLYGPHGFVAINERRNPQIRNWRSLRPGETLYIVAPRTVPQAEPAPEPVHAPELEAKPELAPLEPEAVQSEPQPPPPTLPVAPTPKPIPRKKRSVAVRTPTVLAVARAVPLVGDAIVLPKLRLNRASLFVGHGPLSGLTLGADYVQAASEAFDGHIFDLGWARVAAGWRFAFALPFLFDRVTVTPAGGFWQLAGHMPIASSTGDLQRTNLTIRHTPSGSYEIGLERRLGAFMGHGTYAREVTLAVFGLGHGDASLSTERYGLDLAYGRWPTAASASAPRLSLLTFFSHEVMTVSGGSSQKIDTLSPHAKAQTDADGSNHNGVTFGLNHCGAGVVLDW